jgi:hypothetical protein
VNYEHLEDKLDNILKGTVSAKASHARRFSPGWNSGTVMGNSLVSAAGVTDKVVIVKAGWAHRR